MLWEIVICVRGTYPLTHFGGVRAVCHGDVSGEVCQGDVFGDTLLAVCQRIRPPDTRPDTRRESCGKMCQEIRPRDTKGDKGMYIDMGL